MMTAKNWNDLIKEADSIAISGHIRPDGDCAGSTLGLAQYIRDNFPQKKVDVYLEPIRECFQFLVGADKIQHEADEQAYALFICCDCGDKERLGTFAKLYERAEQTVCVDHHISNDGFGKFQRIDPYASSTCEILYQLMEADKISKAVATALYLGIVHDTGVFRHNNTTKITMQIAGELLEKGVDNSYIIDETFYAKTYLQNQIMGRALMESQMLMDGKIIFSYMNRDNMKFYGCDSSDLDGIIDQLRMTKGVEVAIFLYETDSHEYKVSMRANRNVNVSTIAKHYGGGGHIRAAGCTMTGNFHDVINNLTGHIEAQLTLEETK